MGPLNDRTAQWIQKELQIWVKRSGLFYPVEAKAEIRPAGKVGQTILVAKGQSTKARAADTPG
jgi:hypothetical protein